MIILLIEAPHERSTPLNNCLNIQVTDWRYGQVSEIDSHTGTLVLLPWPDSSVHPDPAVQDARMRGPDTQEDSEGHLEQPQSQYDDLGILRCSPKDFVEVPISMIKL